jgi:DUF4097 and DUF4098 domain-containing protein YvlB
MRPRFVSVLIVTLGLALIHAAPPAQADFTEEFTFDADRLLVGDLIGEIVVEGHTGSEFLVTVNVQGQDADRDLIGFDQESGATSKLLVVFPTEEHDRYVYPRMGRRSRTNFTPGRHHGSSWIDQLLGDLGRDKIEVRGSGRGLEMWADVTIKVPAGKELAVDSGVGSIQATDVASSLQLRLRSGPITADRIEGEARLDTGSGHVDARDITGSLSIDTGSGHVEAQQVEGDEISIDTGSGHVDLDGAKGSKVLIDTGSGRVRLEDVACRTLEVDTGSGSVDGRRIATDEAEIDTGSGSIDLALDRMGSGSFVLDTGSGSITLRIPEGASGSFDASTGSGSIDVDVEGPEYRRKKRDHVAFDLGDRASDVELDTSSGSIRILQR